MARSKWKLAYFTPSIWRKILLLKRRKFLRSRKVYFDRSSHIPECFSGYSLRIHKGRRYRRLYINSYITGYKFGEFSFSRKPFHYPLRKSLKRKNQFFRK